MTPEARTFVAVAESPIDHEALLARVRTPAAGAVVLFLGTARDISAGRPVEALEYEAYPAMAESNIREIAAAAHARWPLAQVAVVHRFGKLELGESAVAVAVSSAHRAEAFDAARWIMDTIKAQTPIWKREHWADGAADWVHPQSPVGGGCT